MNENETTAEKMQEKNTGSKSTFKSIIVCVILVLAGILTIRSCFADDSIDMYEQAYKYSQEIVCNEYLWKPKSAKFPKYQKDFVIDTEAGVEYDGVEYHYFRVSSYVDYENQFGNEERGYYEIKVGICLTQDHFGEYIYQLVDFQ